MAHYMVQGGYTSETWAGLVKKPEDRTAAVRAAFESLGGRLEALYYTLGADDFIVLAEVPDNVQAAAVGVLVASTGRYRNVRTTPLLTPQELLHALEGAGKIGFRPAGT